MIKAYEAHDMAKKANETVNKESFDKMWELVEFAIMCEADTGNCGTYFHHSEFESTVGIEFVIDGLRENGFDVIVETNDNHGFYSMYVSW